MNLDIHIVLKLEVHGLDIIYVPGCEPTSAMSSPTLMRWSTCHGASVKLRDALAAVPGSHIEFQINSGKSAGARRKWFVLPPYDPDCPCKWMPDYYQILKDLAAKQPPEEPDYPQCEVDRSGFCPPKVVPPPPPVSSYKEEGTLYGVTPTLLNCPRNWSEPNLVNPVDNSDPYLMGPAIA